MQITLKPGDELTICLDVTDIEITIKLTAKEFTIESNMPDSDGKDGVLYRERIPSK